MGNGVTAVDIPTDITGLCIRVFADSGHTFDGIAKYKMLTAPSNNSLYDMVTENAIKENAIKLNEIQKTYNGISYAWNGDGYRITGSYTAYSFADLCASPDAIPEQIKLGETYRVTRTLPSNVAIRFMFYKDNPNTTSSTTTIYGTGNTLVVIPTEITGLRIRLCVEGGTSFDDIATVKILPLPHSEYLRERLIDFDDVPRMMVSFVDDDTTSDDYVTKYHDACTMVSRATMQLSRHILTMGTQVSKNCSAMRMRVLECSHIASLKRRISRVRREIFGNVELTLLRH